MYRVNFPSRLTDEEKLLRKKYKLLRQKKELLEKLSAEKDDYLNLLKRKKALVNDSSSSDDSDEREMENKREDPKELAKKLVQSGAIVLRKSEPTASRTFKRTQALERKLSLTPRPPPPLKMKIKRVNDGGPKDSMVLSEGTSAMKPKPRSSTYVCRLPTQLASLSGSQSSTVGAGMGARTSSSQPSSSSSSANQPSSSFYKKAGPSSSSAATDWHKLAEANRQRMNESRRDFVDYKRRGLVSYKDVDGSSDDD